MGRFHRMQLMVSKALGAVSLSSFKMMWVTLVVVVAGGEAVAESLGPSLIP